MTKMRANYLTITYEDDTYNPESTTTYENQNDYSASTDDDRPSTIAEVLENELEFYEDDSTHEVHIYKLYKVIKNKRIIVEREVEDVVVDEVPTPSYIIPGDQI